MELESFCRQSRIVVVAGKGGVGKTTVAAALSKMAADAGLRVLTLTLDDSTGLTSLFEFEGALGYASVELYQGAGVGAQAGGVIEARSITPDDALVEYLADHGLGRILKRLVSAGAVDVVATTIPGIRELLVLGKIKQLEQEGRADLIVLDAPAAGHAVTFLTSPKGLLDAARGGPVRVQATDVVSLLTDPTRCQVILVTLPEETPVNELVETAYRLEDEVGIALGPVIVNACYPVLPLLDTDPMDAARAAQIEPPSPELAARLAKAARFRSRRQQLQGDEVERLASELPLEQLRLPYLFRPEVGREGLEILANALATGIEELTGEHFERVRG
jgi:anion-transporting  ArsA/GET3 family ATPase